jgi:multiple sugar transport system substrate-binding protein
MFSFQRIWLILIIFFLLCSCRTHKGKDDKLLFWCATNPRELDLCTSFTNAWNQSHPAENFHLQPIPEGQSSEEVILAAVVGKTTPDIYANMWQGNVEMYARAGVLIPLDTISGFLQFIQERCDSAVIKEITSADGHIYQVPWKVNPFMSIYNKTLFTKNGIHDLPGTYSAYRHAAAIFKANSLLNGWTQKWFGYTEVKEIWYQRLFNFYPLYLAASGGAPLVINNKASFNNKYAIEVFAFLQSLYRDEYFSRENLSASEDPFVAQLIATKWTGPWEIAYLKTIPDLNFEFGYFEPQVPDDHTGPIYRKNLQSDPYYSEYFKENPMMIPFAKELPYVKGVDNCEVIVEVLDIISQEYESCVVYGKKTPEKAIQDAETAVNVLLASASPTKLASY